MALILPQTTWKFEPFPHIHNERNGSQMEILFQPFSVHNLHSAYKMPGIVSPSWKQEGRKSSSRDPPFSSLWDLDKLGPGLNSINERQIVPNFPWKSFSMLCLMSAQFNCSAQLMPAVRPLESESWQISFSIGHRAWRGHPWENRPPNRESNKGQKELSCLWINISQFIAESQAVHVTSGNNSQDEILTSAALDTAGALHMTVQVSVYLAFCRKFKGKN